MIKILIVDDHPEKCKLLYETYFADKYDFHIDSATSYQRAVQLSSACKFNYNAVICDLNLPTEDVNEKCNGKNLYDTYHENYKNCIFLLYTEYPNTVKDNETRAVCISTDSLAQRIPKLIEYFSQPKTEEEKSQREGEIMTNPVKVDWFKFIPIVILTITVVAGYSVMRYKVDSNCNEFLVYKKETNGIFENIKNSQQSTNIVVARMDEKLTALMKSMDDLSKELKRR
jgi:CheY-like chemotaxis protein